MSKKNKVKVGEIEFGKDEFIFIGGPCVIEDESSTLKVAEKIKKLADELNIHFIFKSSYLKDNRSSELSYQGPGLEKGLKILERVKKEVGVPVLSDVHTPQEVDMVKEVLDILQLPAFLCMQTSLTLALARTGKPINIKKGQFIAPQDVKKIINKIKRQGNSNILITERGTFFGYHNLIVDFRSFKIISENGFPVVFDAGHSVRNYGIPSEDPRGGDRSFIPLLIKAALATGYVDALFLEVHEDPENAKCDASTQWPLKNLRNLLKVAIEFFKKGKESLKENSFDI
ncbi:MAG: 3-deoxy-8-phosphooctulonate synthase [Candidatus Hydrothermales bacterium]